MNTSARRTSRFVVIVAFWGLGQALAGSAEPAATQSANPERPPNVLFILADQYRWDCLGTVDAARNHTPHLDRLAREGILFNRAYAAQPVCSPNRAAIVTGMYPHSAGVQDNCTGGSGPERSLPDTRRTLSEMLAPAGYDCGYFGKWHLGRRDAFETFPDYPNDGRGKDHYFGKGETRRYSVDVITEDAVGFLARPRTKPFYAYVSYYPPHPPFVAPPGYEERYGNIADPQERAYRAMCTKVDEAVGELVAALDRLGQTENTIVVFTSDHGHNFRQRWNEHYKRLCYDSSARVPLILRWPEGLPAGRRTDGLISSVDLTPTLLGLIGRPIPNALEGEDLSPFVRGQSDHGRPCVFIENVPFPFAPEKGEERCVFDGRWKLILSTHRSPELFDLSNDPAEEINRWETRKHGAEVGRLLHDLSGWAERTRDDLAPRLVAAARGN